MLHALKLNPIGAAMNLLRRFASELFVCFPRAVRRAFEDQPEMLTVSAMVGSVLGVLIVVAQITGG